MCADVSSRQARPCLGPAGYIADSRRLPQHQHNTVLLSCTAVGKLPLKYSNTSGSQMKQRDLPLSVGKLINTCTSRPYTNSVTASSWSSVGRSYPRVWYADRIATFTVSAGKLAPSLRTTRSRSTAMVQGACEEFNRNVSYVNFNLRGATFYDLIRVHEFRPRKGVRIKKFDFTSQTTFRASRVVWGRD